jgi:uncharacterized protein (TIGR03083 family)
MRELVLHQGEVHRWANAFVADARTAPFDSAEVLGPLPGDHDLADWFRDGYHQLVDTLANADPGVECWSFLAAPSPLAFWARRQCHETGIHRADAQSASGEMSPFPSSVAADGIDELVSGFVTRKSGRLRSDTPVRLGVHASDTDDRWMLHITQDPVVTERISAAIEADCVLTGHASDLHLFLWNRVAADQVEALGDTALLDLWRDTTAIRWS